MEEELDEYGIPIKKTVKSENLDEYGIPIKKKDDFIPTEENLASSGSTKVPETSSDSKEDDVITLTDEQLDEANSEQPSLKTPEEKKSYLGHLFKDVAIAGFNDFNKAIAGIPESLYTIFSIPQNAVAYVTGLDIEASSKKFKDTYNVKNPILDAYIKEGEEINKRVETFNQENYKSSSIYENIQKGNYTDALQLTVSGVVRSAPISASMMVGGATMSTSQLATVGTVAFTNQNQEDIDKDNPNMSEIGKNIKAVGLSGAEMVFESLGTGQIGSVYKDIILKEGKEVGSKIFKDGLISAYKKSLKAYGAVSGALGEMIEEGATQITQNMINGKPYMEGVFDAMAIGGASGTVMSAPITAINAKNKINDLIKAKTASKTMSNESKAKVDKIDDAVEILDNDLQQDLPDALKEKLQAVKQKLTDEKGQVIESDYEKFKNLPQEQKDKLGDLESKIDVIKTEYEEIENNPNISRESKDLLKSEKSNEAENLIKSKNEIINPKEEILTNDKTETPEKTEKSEILPEQNKEVKTEEINETQAQGDTPTNENIEPAISEDLQQGGNSNIQPAKNVDPNTNDVEVKKVKSLKGATYDVHFKEDGNVSKIISPKDGREIPKFIEVTVKKTGKKYIKVNANYSRIESDALGTITENKSNEERKVKVLKSLDKFTPTDAYSHALEYLGSGGAVSLESAKKETRLSAKEVKWSTRGDKKYSKDSELPSVEKAAENILANAKQPLDMQEVRNALIDLISNKESVKNIEDEIVNKVEKAEIAIQEQEAQVFLGQLSEKELSLYQSIKAEDDYISELTDNEVIEYFKEQYKQNSEYYEQETKKTNESRAVESNSTKTTNGGKQKTEARQNIDSKKEIAFENIDNFFNDIKNALPGITDEDLKGNGLTQDQLIDLMAKSVKFLVGTGIELNAAIQQTVKSIKDKLGIDIDPNDIKARLEPKKQKDDPKTAGEFKNKPGKKSLLARLVTGGNSDVITEKLAELNPNYTTRNQEKADVEAQKFIDEIGVAESLKAIEDGLVKNADIKMLIFNEALNRLQNEIDSDTNLEDREALLEKFHDLTNKFADEATNYGQGISILNYIYNKDQTLKYNLAKQIEDYKRRDPKGEIPADVKQKYEELDAKLKDVEKRLKEAEVRAKKAEDDLALKNIKDDIDRKNKLAKINKYKTAKAAKELANKIRQAKVHRPGIFSAATPASLVWDSAIEVVAKTIEAGGKIADAVAKGMDFIKESDWYKSLSKEDKQEAEKEFNKYINKSAEKKSVTINEEGKIEVPTELFRYYVEQGETDIDVISQKIKDDIKDEYPDAEIRDIRDAITNYGKTVNPSKDEIKKEMARLRSTGKLISAYEDALNKISPKKSGLQRAKPTQEMRDLRKKINQAIKDNNLDAIDLDAQWKSALQKVKAQLQNQIEDLDKQIAKGEKRKIERNPIKLDAEAENLKQIRDEKKKFLDELVGKPELTEEQKIERAENLLEKSIEKLEKEINEGSIGYKGKETQLNSQKLTDLRAKKKALNEIKKQLREEAGLVEEQRLKSAKQRVKKQTEVLRERIANRDFAKKEVKPIVADNELNQIKAEREDVFEEYEKLKYLQELKDRSTTKKVADGLLEFFGIARALKASLDLGLIGIQLRGFTYSELLRNPKQLGIKFVKMLGAIGSKRKSDKAMGLLKSHPEYHDAKKFNIGMTYPDLRNEAREEMAAGNMLASIWSIPIIAMELAGGKKAKNITQAKRKSLGDTFIDAAKTQYNKLAKNKLEIKDKTKFSIKEQYSNANPFESVERGLSTYGNQLRFEEWIRGVERLKAEGKDKLNDVEHYKDLANYIRTFSGRANPAGFELNQKALNIFFFSFKNAVSVFQQLNPVYYMYLNRNNFKEGNYKPSVANKMAMATMFKSITSTAATMLFITTMYNAFKSDDDEELTIESDPTSSDFGKLRIGDFRYDPWGGYIPLITLYARLFTEEVKKSDGSKYKFGKSYFGIKNRWDATSRFIINKESPSFQMIHKYLTSTEAVAENGETYRKTPWGKKLTEDDSYSFYPIFIGSVKEAIEKDYDGVKSFLTAYSVLGLGNTQDYGSKPKNGLKELKPLKKLKELKPLKKIN